MRRIRLMQEEQRWLTLAQFKAMAREQFFMLLVYPEEAVAAIADLLPETPTNGARHLPPSGKS